MLNLGLKMLKSSFVWWYATKKVKTKGKVTKNARNDEITEETQKLNNAKKQINWNKLGFLHKSIHKNKGWLEVWNFLVHTKS